MNMTELMKKGRIVELSNIIYPGKEERRLEIRRKRVMVGEFMYEIDTLSHIGTHAETPNHFIPAIYEGAEAKDLTDFPPETWMGEAVFVDLSSLKPGDLITPEFLEQFPIKEGDIVLIGNAKKGEDGTKVRMSSRSAEYLLNKKIKVLGMDWSYQLEESFEGLDKMKIHLLLLGNDIPLIEGLCYLDQLKERRFYFIGLPYRVKGCDGWPIRAIAIEGVL